MARDRFLIFINVVSSATLTRARLLLESGNDLLLESGNLLLLESDEG